MAAAVASAGDDDVAAISPIIVKYLLTMQNATRASDDFNTSDRRYGSANATCYGSLYETLAGVVGDTRKVSGTASESLRIRIYRSDKIAVSHYDVNRIDSPFLLGLRDGFRGGRREGAVLIIIRIKQKSKHVSRSGMNEMHRQQGL